MKPARCIASLVSWNQAEVESFKSAFGEAAEVWSGQGSAKQSCQERWQLLDYF
jgi:hypothetical protein